MRGLDGNPGIKVHVLIIVLYFIAHVKMTFVYDYYPALSEEITSFHKSSFEYFRFSINLSSVSIMDKDQENVPRIVIWLVPCADAPWASHVISQGMIAIIDKPEDNML